MITTLLQQSTDILTECSSGDSLWVTQTVSTVINQPWINIPAPETRCFWRTNRKPNKTDNGLHKHTLSVLRWSILSPPGLLTSYWTAI